MTAPIGENGLNPAFLLILLVCVYGANFYLQTKNNCFSHSTTMDEPPSKKRRTLSSNDEENGENVRRPYIIERISETRARRYNSEEITFRAKFNDDLQGKKLLDVTDDLHDMFQDIMDNVSANHAENNDRARLSIRHAGLDREIFIHCQPKHNITADVIMERLVHSYYF